MVTQHRKLPSPDHYRYSSGNWDTPATRTPESTGSKKAEYDPEERFPGREFPVTVRKIGERVKEDRVTGAAQGACPGDGQKNRGENWGRQGYRCDAGRSSR